MDNLMAAALSAMIHEQFEKWRAQGDTISNIEKGLLQGCTEGDSTDKVFSRMIFNSMEIAAGISAKVILEMLLTAEVIQPKGEGQLRRTILSVVKEKSPKDGTD